MDNLNKKIEQIIINQMKELNREDLYREPLVSVSSAFDPRYEKLKEIVGDWHLNPTELLPDAQSVISYFVPFTKEVVAGPRDTDDGSPIWAEAYAVINAYFNVIGKTVSEYLNSLGYSTYLIAGTHTYDPNTLEAKWSHKSAAAIAGLGTFGANRILMTPKGSGGRLCTILTSAPLETNLEPAVDRCLYNKNGSCGLCFKICPVNALKPGAFEKFSCHKVLKKNAKNLIEIGKCDVCGKCINICPFSYME